MFFSKTEYFLEIFFAMFKPIALLLPVGHAFTVGSAPLRTPPWSIAMECRCECDWEEVDEMKHRVMDTYFGMDVDADQRCEVFCIEGVPAASMLYNTTNAAGGPVVDAFYLNKAMMLLFDAGSHMRATLYKRHRHADVEHATNRNDFIFF